MKFDQNYSIEQRLVSTYSLSNEQLLIAELCSMLDVDSAQCAQSWGHYMARYVG